MNADSTNSAPALRPARTAKFVVAVAAFGIAAVYAFYVVLSQLLSLDEGYLMITVKGFLEGKPLYDTVFTQYGPFFYIHQWILRGLLHVPLTHDATRLICWITWLAASGLCGIAGARLTRSWLAGVFVFMQAVVHLHDLSFEPGHPQELVALLVALGALAATVRPSDPERLSIGGFGLLEALALVTAMLACTKINVGIFFGFAFFLTVRCHAAGRLAHWSNFLLLAFAGVVPIVLMRQLLNEEWCRHFSVMNGATLFAAFMVAWRFAEKRDENLKQFIKPALCFCVASAVFIAFAVFHGSSGHGLLDGLLVTPMKMPAVASLPVALSKLVPASALLSALVAAVVIFMPAALRNRVVVVLKAAFVIAGAFGFVNDPTAQFSFVLPWVWLLAVPRTAQVKEDTFPRMFVCFAAAAQPLQAFPVAGTQITVGTFLLVLVYGMCLADVLATVRAGERVEKLLARSSVATVRLAQALGLIAFLFVFSNVWCRLPAVHTAYANCVSLDLPGAHLVRVVPPSAELYRNVTAFVSKESDCFLTYPCNNSLYFWAGMNPPTELNGTGWLQFSVEQQQYILDKFKSASKPRFLVQGKLVQQLKAMQYPELLPLVKFLSDDCTELGRFGPFAVFAPKAAPLTAAKQ